MAEVAKKAADKPVKNVVHEQRILVETIKKELREQKLYTEFTVNPFTKSQFFLTKAKLNLKLNVYLLKNRFWLTNRTFTPKHSTTLTVVFLIFNS